MTMGSSETWVVNMSNRLFLLFMKWWVRRYQLDSATSHFGLLVKMGHPSEKNPSFCKLLTETAFKSWKKYLIFGAVIVFKLRRLRPPESNFWQFEMECGQNRMPIKWWFWFWWWNQILLKIRFQFNYIFIKFLFKWNI